MRVLGLRGREAEEAAGLRGASQSLDYLAH